MSRRERGLFAGGGIQLPSFKVTSLTVIAAFAVGIGAGWFTTILPDMLEARNAEPSPSPSVTPMFAPAPDVSLPPLPPIDRDIDDNDLLAGLRTLDVVTQGEGTFTLVTGSTDPDPVGPPVRWVSFEVEDGIGVNEQNFAAFAMDALNHPRGWGSNGRVQYARTDGVADLRIVLASPYTAAALCPNPHEAAPDRAQIESDLEATPTPSPSPSPDASLEPEDETCAARSIMAISLYDWAAGLSAYDDRRTQSRVYQIMHGVGHLMGFEDVECVEGRAEVMVDQRELPEECSTNPWPYPNAEIPDEDPDATQDPEPENLA